MKYGSYMSQQVVRTVLESETCALADAFDLTCILKRDFEHCLNCVVRLCLVMDSHSIFDTIIKASYTLEKRV